MIEHHGQKAPNKAEQAYDLIESMITFQDLKPGSMVSETMLMERIGLGRTPVREALQRLARERMVEIHPRRGAFVPPISVEVQLKLLELRRAVEELAVRMATHRASPVQKRIMLDLANRLYDADAADARGYGALLKRSHDVTVQAAQNEYLQLAMAPLQGLSRRFWFAHVSSETRGREMAMGAALHADVLRAICHGDEKAASAASLALNGYLTDFAYRTLRPVAGSPPRPGR